MSYQNLNEYLESKKQTCRMCLDPLKWFSTEKGVGYCDKHCEELFETEIRERFRYKTERFFVFFVWFFLGILVLIGSSSTILSLKMIWTEIFK